MKKVYLILVLLLVAAIPEIRAQSHNKAQIFEMVPIFGHTQMVEEALAAHSAWRAEHGDPWSWDVMQVVVGDNMNTFYARTGNHTWADFDTYNLEGAPEHFNQTVLPHLQSFSSMVTSMDTTNVFWPADLEFNMVTVANYDLIPARQRAFGEALGKFSSAIQKRDSDAYHSFHWINYGGDGVTDMMGVFPSMNWADMEEPDPTVMQMVLEEYGEEEATQIFQDFLSGVRNTKSRLLVRRPDLSVQGSM